MLVYNLNKNEAMTSFLSCISACRRQLSIQRCHSIHIKDGDIWTKTRTTRVPL